MSATTPATPSNGVRLLSRILEERYRLTAGMRRVPIGSFRLTGRQAQRDRALQLQSAATVGHIPGVLLRPLDADGDIYGTFDDLRGVSMSHGVREHPPPVVRRALRTPRVSDRFARCRRSVTVVQAYAYNACDSWRSNLNMYKEHR